MKRRFKKIKSNKVYFYINKFIKKYKWDLILGFLVPEGYGNFTIHYKLQEYTDLGFVILGLPYITLIIIVSINFIKRRKEKS